MGATKEIIKMAKEHNGTVTTVMVVAAGFSCGNNKYLVEKGMIEKFARGVYILSEVWNDEIFDLQNQFKRGIYFHEIALFLWDLTDRTPNRYHMTFPVNYNLTRPKEQFENVYDATFKHIPQRTAYNLRLIKSVSDDKIMKDNECMPWEIFDV